MFALNKTSKILASALLLTGLLSSSALASATYDGSGFPPASTNWSAYDGSGFPPASTNWSAYDGSGFPPASDK